MLVIYDNAGNEINTYTNIGNGALVCEGLQHDNGYKAVLECNGIKKVAFARTAVATPGTGSGDEWIFDDSDEYGSDEPEQVDVQAILSDIGRSVGDFFIGLKDSLETNNIVSWIITQIIQHNYTLSQPGSIAYWAGKCVGDITSIIGGEILINIGLGSEAASLVLDATGIGALFGGLALNAAGAIAITVGASTITVSVGNLFNDVQNLIHQARSNGNTSSGGKYVPKTGDWRATGKTVD